MSPETWRRVKDVFDAAAEIKPSHREEFLAEICGGHPELIEEVRSLLASLEDAGDFIESSPVLPESVAGPDPDPPFRTGTNIGPYRIVQVIGEGGMGMFTRPCAWTIFIASWWR